MSEFGTWQVKNDYDGRTEVIANVDGETFSDGTSSYSYSYDFICNTGLDEHGDDQEDQRTAARRARLIASAPDMLEALTDIRDAGLGGYLTPELCADIVEKAIAKATGEPS